MSGLKIIPVKVGSLKRPKSLFNYNFKDDKSWDTPLLMWYIEGAERKILVDTGGIDPQTEFARKHRQPYTRPADEHPAAALKKIGVAVDDVDLVIITHLHWDHCYNNGLFKNATFFVQKKELQFAIAPIPTQEHTYESITVGMTPPWFETKRWEVVDGDAKIDKGVSLIFTPGHTPGIQSVLVETEQGPYLIAGDAVPLWENWKGAKSIPNGIHVDLVSYFKSFKKMERLNAVVLPGHDPAIFAHSVYPNKNEAYTAAK